MLPAVCPVAAMRPTGLVAVWDGAMGSPNCCTLTYQANKPIIEAGLSVIAVEAPPEAVESLSRPAAS